MLTRRNRGRSAFTLLELLVVVAIIGILAGMVFVLGWRSVRQARTAACMNKMRQIGMAKLHAEGMDVESSDELWDCPEGGSYAFSKYIERLRDLTDPAATVLLYESKGYGTGDEYDVAQRHMGGSNYIYCDGHARFSKSIPPFKP